MSNTRPALTDPNRSPDYAGYLRTAYSDAFQGSAVADFAYNTLKVTKVATIHDGSAYAQALVGVFVDSFQKLGGTITDQEAVAKTDTDMRPVLTKIAATGPEAIYFPTFVAAGGYICAQMHSVPGLEKAAMLSSDGVASTDFLKACGPQVVGLYDSGPDFTQFPSTYKDLVAKYQAKYGQSPTSIYHGQAYDAAGIIFAAIQKVAVVDADGTVHIGRQALRDAIYATTDYQGVTGTLSCNASGDCGSHAIAVYQVANADLWDLTNATNPNPKKVWPTTP
jgi:branched-chain amino acid transport system substrate-binding protein